jgi:uncharacterized protein (TIGR02647 family)
MPLTTELIDEIKILALYNASTSQEGIKVHASAEPSAIAATTRLFEKGLISQNDGGYLTDSGIEVSEHTQAVVRILNSN